MKIPDTQIAVTLYNLREHCTTESDLDRTLDKVCAIGYQAIQLSGVKLPLEVIKKQLDSHSLYCCATHESFNTITQDRKNLIDKMKFLECDFCALGMPPKEYIYDYAKTCEFIDLMMEAGTELWARHIKLGYHNHHREFTKQKETGKTFLETFYTRTENDWEPVVYAELDVHWVTRGGGSPVKWIWNVNGRMPVCHFKDFTLVDEQPVFCEIGEGNLDWPAIIEACRETNVRWYSIEQDSPFPGRDIFDSIKISYDNLKKMGVK